MRYRAPFLAAAMAALAAGGIAVAQTQPEPIPLPPLTAPPAASPEEGVDLIERGAGILFRHLFEQVAPEMGQISREMSDALALLGPAVSDLSVLVDDMQNYETPERLENGDIIIRRRPGAPPPPPVGEGLRQFTDPMLEPPAPAVPIDPGQPQLEL